MYRPSQLVRSDEGKKLQRKIWGEILEVLEDKNPGVKQIVKEAESATSRVS